MLPNPLHPAVVHFPIVLAFLLPIAAVIALVRVRRGAEGRAAWTWIVVLAAALFGSALVAVETGEDQEEIVESVVAESAIHAHEEGAELLRLASGLALAICAVGLLGGRAGAIGRYAGTAAVLVALVSAIDTGRSGGALVYEHGAAAAYANGSSLATRGEGRRAPARDEDDRDDDDR